MEVFWALGMIAAGLASRFFLVFLERKAPAPLKDIYLERFQARAAFSPVLIVAGSLWAALCLFQ
jgi:hypothetical protein